jgi:hypothetical protein
MSSTEPRIRLPPGLFGLLLDRQRRRGYRDEVTERLGVVWLHTDMGPSFYLAADGRVLADDCIAREPLHDVVPPALYVALVAASKTIGAPELLELLPARPIGAQDCERCAGARHVSWGRDVVTREPGQIVCPDCAGLGWRAVGI